MWSLTVEKSSTLVKFLVDIIYNNLKKDNIK